MRKYLKSDGWLGVEALGSLFIAAILIVIFSNLMQSGLDNLKSRNVAQHFKIINKGAVDYAKQNYLTLMPQVTINSGPTISVDDLKKDKCLPDRIKEKNAWGQSYRIEARKDDVDKLTMIVITTGGKGHSTKKPNFANILVPKTAALAGVGYITTGDLGVSNFLQGPYGIWDMPLSKIGITATAGHLGAITSLTDDDIDHDFLYRVKVPGMPELNAMATSLDMTNHDINTVRSLKYASESFLNIPGFCETEDDEGRSFLDKERGLYICRDGKIQLINDTGNSLLVKSSSIVSNGAVIEKPECPEGTNTEPQIFITPSMIASDKESPTMASVQAWAVSLNDEEWQVKIRILTEKNEWIYPEPKYARAVVFTTCSRKDR